MARALDQTDAFEKPSEGENGTVDDLNVYKELVAPSLSQGLDGVAEDEQTSPLTNPTAVTPSTSISSIDT